MSHPPLPIPPEALPERVRVALVQAAPVFLDRDRSLRLARRLIELAADEGARLVAFPETWLAGYPIWLDVSPGAARWDDAGAKALYRLLQENAVEWGDEHTAMLAEAAEECAVDVVIGAHERVGRTLMNSVFLFGAHGAATLHRKLVPTHGERLVWGMAETAMLAPLPSDYGGISALVCWEHWMPELRAAVHRKGALVHVAQWPWVKEMNRVASRHFAFEGRCFVLAVGAAMTRGAALEAVRSRRGVPAPALEMLETMPGADDDWLLAGGSTVFGPDGAPLAGPAGRGEELLGVDLPLKAAVEEIMTLDVAGHYARPDIFS
ncbi:MAG: carbon-nitrogen hydrolase family protein, partial [Alphaproteobacteria bacterium]